MRARRFRRWPARALVAIALLAFAAPAQASLRWAEPTTIAPPGASWHQAVTRARGYALAVWLNPYATARYA